MCILKQKHQGSLWIFFPHDNSLHNTIVTQCLPLDTEWTVSECIAHWITTATLNSWHFLTLVGHEYNLGPIRMHQQQRPCYMAQHIMDYVVLVSGIWIANIVELRGEAKGDPKTRRSQRVIRRSQEGHGDRSAVRQVLRRSIY